MMIINLNLLPPDRKHLLDRLINFLFIKNILEFLIIALAVIAMVLLWGWIVLIGQFNDLAQSSISIGRDYTAYNAEIRRVNRVIRSVGEAADGYFAVTPRLLELIATTPDSIRFNAVNIDRENKTISIMGTARTRDDLLTYQTILKNITWMEAATMPNTQLLQKENINFEYRTKIKGWPAIKIISAPKSPAPRSTE